VILLLGGSGLVGTGIQRAYKSLKEDIIAPNHKELDLLRRDDLKNYIIETNPSTVIMAAGVVGGIEFNSMNQISQYKSNQVLNMNLLQICEEMQVQKLLLISSSCIYPQDTEAPISEESFGKGVPELTNIGYANAKIEAIHFLDLVRRERNLNWGACMPTNVLGYERNFDSDSHVVPSLIRKLHFAKLNSLNEVYIWGDGTPVREFIYNMDLGLAVNHISKMEKLPLLINAGSNQPVSIKEIAIKLAKLMNFEGEIIFDTSKPNGHPNKSLDSSILFESGWKPNYDLDTLLSMVVDEFIQHRDLIEVRKEN